MSGPVVFEHEHRAALRVLAYAVLTEAIMTARDEVRIRRAFFLSFADDDVLPRRRGAAEHAPRPRANPSAVDDGWSTDDAGPAAAAG